MKILRTYFGEIMISLFINVGLIYVLLYIIKYSNFFSSGYITFPLILLTPILHIFFFLFLIKKIFKRNRLSNIILYLITNSIYFLYSYLSYRFIYHHFYTYSLLQETGPTETDILIDSFNGVYITSKLSFMLFVVNLLLLGVFVFYKKYKNK